MISIAHSTGQQASFAAASSCDPELSAPPGSSQRRRDEWIGVCAAHLHELRPHDDQRALDLIATEMWFEVGSFDPAIAAEMECEAWPPEH